VDSHIVFPAQVTPDWVVIIGKGLLDFGIFVCDVLSTRLFSFIVHRYFFYALFPVVLVVAPAVP